jgi:hypothetical protein
MDLGSLSAILGAFGLSASAGLNAYIPLLLVSLTARFAPGLMGLGEGYELLASPWVIGALIILLIVEVLADKVPVIDHLNDLVGVLVRPAAGAILFASQTGGIDFLDPTIALVLGLLVAGAAHGAKATARPVVTASTGGLGNPVVSTLEDVAALLTSLAAILAPLLVGAGLIGLTLLVALWWWRRRRRASRRAMAA